MAHYPSGIDSFNNPTGSDTLASPDHAELHREVGSAVIGIETTLGTNSGTAILKNFTAGEFAAKTANETFGTSTWIGGTIGTAIVGTSRFIGGTVQNALVGTSTIQGGTMINPVIGTPTVQSGTFGTPIIDHIASSGTAVSIKSDNALSPTVGTLTDAPSGTITINAALGNLFELTFGTTAGNRTLAAPLNLTDGQALSLRIKQNAAATGTLVLNSVFGTSSDVGAIVIGTADTWNYLGYRYHAAGTKLHFQGQSLNLI